MRLRHVITVLALAVTAASLSLTPATGTERNPRSTSTSRSTSRSSSKKNATKKRKTKRTKTISSESADGKVLLKRDIILAKDGKPATLEVFADGIMITNNDGTRMFLNASNPVNVMNSDGSRSVIQIFDNTIKIEDYGKDSTTKTLIEGLTGETTVLVTSPDNGPLYPSTYSSSTYYPSTYTSTKSSTSTSSSYSSASPSTSASYSYSYSNGYNNNGKNVDSNIYMYLPEDSHGEYYLPELHVSKSQPYSTCLRRLAFSSDNATEVNVYFMTNKWATIKNVKLYLGNQSYSPTDFSDITLQPNNEYPEYLPCLSFKFNTGYRTDEPGKNDRLVMTMQDGKKISVSLQWPAVKTPARQGGRRNEGKHNGTVPPRDPMADD